MMCLWKNIVLRPPTCAGVLAVSWTCVVLFMVSFFVSAAAAAAASRARTKLSEAHASVLRGLPSKRFAQPAASPPGSPAKSCKSFSSAYGEVGRALCKERFARAHNHAHYRRAGLPSPCTCSCARYLSTPCQLPLASNVSPATPAEPFAESPKKWVQPANPRTAHCPVTSDGRRTILLLDGEPVPLSPNLSPSSSPLAGRSPAHSFRRSPDGSPLARSLTHGGGSGSVGSFSHVLLPPGVARSQQQV